MDKRIKVQTDKKYLTFMLLKEEYGIPIENVKEIMAFEEITPLPQTPDYLKGVINLRGQILPVLDLRLRFELPSEPYGEKTSIIIVEMSRDEEVHYFGIVVDITLEVVPIKAEQITKVPYINAKIKRDYIAGISEDKGNVRILLNIEKVLDEQDLVQITALNELTTEGGSDGQE